MNENKDRNVSAVLRIPSETATQSKGGFFMASQANPTDYKHRLAASFDSRVNYDDEYTVGRATQLVELVQLKDGHSVLDLATGTGIVAVVSARAVGTKGNVIGVDISPG